ncbi:hypothetical protein BH23PAT2_BH23PAT2_07380 [soil metagenome]
MEIKKIEFESYEAVRLSGATNMFDINMVVQLSGLDRSIILEVMKNYTHYRILYTADSSKG